MTHFGVHYIPPSRSPFYRLGSSIVGYDVRAGTLPPSDNAIRAQIPAFDESFVRHPHGHGLHCTLVGTYQMKAKALPAIEQAIDDILNCFAPETRFTLQAHEDFITFWGQHRQIVVLRYEANPALLVLHTLLAAALVPFAKSSSYYPRYQTDVAHFAPHEWHRIQRFYKPNVLDNFHPHFTLLHPYRGTHHEALARVLRGIFGRFTSHTAESLCLVVKEKDDERWHIAREFPRTAYPVAPSDV